MGRHHEVRAAAMAKTGKIKSALYGRASKEAYMAARQGSSNPAENLALRAVFEKYKGKSVPKDVFDRAIKKAQGGDAEVFISGRYEAFGPGNSYLIIDSLTDKPNRALTEIRTLVVRKGGHMGTVMYNFNECGVLVFKGSDKDSIEELLIMEDIDVNEVFLEDDFIIVYVAPTDLSKAQELIRASGVESFEVAEIKMIPNETIKIENPEHLTKFTELIDGLDELDDVQAVFHNVELE